MMQVAERYLTYNDSLVPIFWSSAGGGLRYVSNANGFDDLYIDGDLKSELKVSLSSHAPHGYGWLNISSLSPLVRCVLRPRR